MLRTPRSCRDFGVRRWLLDNTDKCSFVWRQNKPFKHDDFCTALHVFKSTTKRQCPSRELAWLFPSSARAASNKAARCPARSPARSASSSSLKTSTSYLPRFYFHCFCLVPRPLSRGYFAAGASIWSWRRCVQRRIETFIPRVIPDASAGLLRLSES